MWPDTPARLIGAHHTQTGTAPRAIPNPHTLEARRRGNLRRERAGIVRDVARKRERLGLPAGVVLLLVEIAAELGADDYVEIGQVALARKLGMRAKHADRTVRRWVAALRVAGVLSVDGAPTRWDHDRGGWGRDRCNRYNLAKRTPAPNRAQGPSALVPALTIRSVTTSPDAHMNRCPDCNRDPGPCIMADTTFCGRLAPP